MLEGALSELRRVRKACWARGFRKAYARIHAELEMGEWHIGTSMGIEELHAPHNKDSQMQSYP